MLSELLNIFNHQLVEVYNPDVVNAHLHQLCVQVLDDWLQLVLVVSKKHAELAAVFASVVACFRTHCSLVVEFKAQSLILEGALALGVVNDVLFKRTWLRLWAIGWCLVSIVFFVVVLLAHLVNLSSRVVAAVVFIYLP